MRPLTQRLSVLAASLLGASAASAQWQQQSPTTVPSARRGAAMTYAIHLDRALLFGGTGNPLPSDETWAYDGANWTLLSPPVKPSGRMEVEMVYDLVRGVTVLYGGFSASTGGANSETWEFDGVTWTQRTPTTNPGGLYRNGISFDGNRGRVVLYGGVGSGVGIPTNKTWEYDGTDWSQVLTAASPGPLDRPAMCFHAGLGKTVLFGGAFNGTLSDATWVYDGSNWAQAPIAGSKPAPRHAAKMVYDDVRGVCVLTGGQDITTIYADTWEFDGTAWTQQPTATQPARDHSLAFLLSQRQVVKFGGLAMAPNTLTDQTWHFGARWNALGTGCPGSNGVPVLTMPDAGRLGGSFTLDLANLHTAPLLAVMVLGLTELPGVPLDFLGMTGCLGFTSPDVLVNVATAGGLATYTWNPVFGTVGDRILAQALCLDPGANPAWLTASNAVATTLGR
jgi:hypothetical protein